MDNPILVLGEVRFI